jgi:hypothetical protein
MAAFTVIDHTELGAAAASWSKTSIPSSYDHLLLKVSARTDTAAHLGNLMLRFNSDTGTNYSQTLLYANTSTPASARSTGLTSIYYGPTVGGASILADTFGAIKIWIPNYANTANFKQASIDGVIENNSTTNAQWNLHVAAGLWSSTAAINAVSLTDLAGGNLVQYSTFTLYGVTGA